MPMLKVTLLFLFLFLVSSTVYARTCRAIALEGGGDKGSYEVGVVSGLVQNLPAEDVMWDVVTGISAGSINAMGMALFKVGDEYPMQQYMLNINSNLTRSLIYKEWPKGPIHGLYNERGIFDTSPLHEFLKEQYAELGGVKDRKVVIGATNLDEGILKTWDETDGDLLPTATYCSSAIPGIFESVTVNGTTYVDGGVIMPLNIFDAIVKCEKIADDYKDITVDIVLTAGSAVHPIKTSNFTAIQILSRTAELERYKFIMAQIANTKVAYPDINWRYTIYPSEPLPDFTPLDFRHKILEEMMEIGRKDAINAIKNHKG